MFIDSHCHLNFECFKGQYDLLFTALAEADVHKLVIPGTQKKEWPEITQLAMRDPSLYYALGLHPHFLSTFEEQDLVVLHQELIAAKNKEEIKCVGLGEIGLDKLVDIDVALQERVFVAQLEIAKALHLPVILHVVKMQSRVLALLKQTQFPYGGVYHAFSGSQEIANEFIKLGFKLGIGGVITYPNAHKTKSTVSQLPLTSFVLETDAPDMPIYQQPTQHNTPLHIPLIFEAFCALRKESPRQVKEQLAVNTLHTFPVLNHTGAL